MEKKRAWIAFCISTIRYSFLINGAPFGCFSSIQGLRQGDLLSPLPFVVVMEVLSSKISTTMDRGLLDGFIMGSRNAA